DHRRARAPDPRGRGDRGGHHGGAAGAVLAMVARPLRGRLLALAGAVSVTCMATSVLSAQTQPGRSVVERERSEYVAWLRDAAVSPLRAIALHPLDGPVTLGPAGSDLPLTGVDSHRLVPQGAVAALEHD